VVASAVALGFSVWPALRPDPRDALAAQLDVKTVEPGVTLDDYLQRTGYRVKAATREDLGTRGYIVYVQIQIKGRKHGNLELHQVVYRAATGRRIANQGPTRDAFFRPDTPNDQWVNQVFVPGPGYDFPVFVRLELFDGDSLMAFDDTHPIRGAR
jgi:hypothetical protein